MRTMPATLDPPRTIPPDGEFPLVMIGAMYENGGNTVQRFLDGHPELRVYPFESQLGTALVQDHLTSLFPVRYRWPVFPLHGTPREDFRMIIDEEAKVRARTPRVSKFRAWPFRMNDEERCDRYCALVEAQGRSRAGNVAAFFRATFDSWRNFRRTGRERAWVGYSPIVTVEADKILGDFPAGHVVHVVRNPWSAYADHKKRPVPQPLERYLLGWCLNQHLALQAAARFAGRMHVVRFEDVVARPGRRLGDLCEAIGVSRVRLAHAAWNRRRLVSVTPWGTIRTPTTAANRRTALELSAAERDEVRFRAGPYLERLGYARFLPR